MWPRFDPFAVDDEKDRPRMFVSYKGGRQHRTDTVRPSYTLLAQR